MTRWTNSQLRRVFGWKDLLQEWNRTMIPTTYINTVMDNLHAATDRRLPNDYPLSHFLTFLNNEQEGIKWLLYEVIAARWLFGTVRLDYVQGLVDCVYELDSGFPAFVGSPLNNTTIRQFVQENLNAEELSSISIMPPLVPSSSRTQAYHDRESYYQEQAERSAHHYTPSGQTVYHTSGVVYTPQAQSSTPVTPQAQSSTPVTPQAQSSKPVYPPIMLRLLRKGLSQTDDDIISIRRVSDDTYTIIFSDLNSKTRNKTVDVCRHEVIDYLKHTLRIIQLDKEPFDSVQVLLPNMPTVLISLENLFSQTRDLIYDSVESVMDNWPVNVPV